MRSEDEGRYQMLWNCGACGTGKLLALDHKFCPACGTPQDVKDRYFPSDDEKIAVQDHPFHGADKVCEACDTPNAGNAGFCAACGSLLDDAKQAKLRHDRVLAADDRDGGEDAKDARGEHRQRHLDEEAQRKRQMSGQPEPAERKKKKGGMGVVGMAVFGCFGLVAVVIVGVILFAIVNSFMSSSGTVQVMGHHWKRTVDIEVYGPKKDDGWQNEVPAKAYDIQCTKKVKDHKKVKDGETCKTRKIDNGDGTFQQKKECKPKYKEEPIYGQKCSFKVDSWSKKRQEQSAGKDLKPAWPTVKLAKTGDCVGCEREGKRVATYIVDFSEPDGTPQTCTFDEAKWRTYNRGDTHEASFGGLSGELQCGSLK